MSKPEGKSPPTIGTILAAVFRAKESGDITGEAALKQEFTGGTQEFFTQSGAHATVTVESYDKDGQLISTNSSRSPT